MPKRDVWQITAYGERNVESWAQQIKGFTEKKPDWIADFRACSAPEAEFDDDLRCEFYITEETVRWALKIATNTLR